MRCLALVLAAAAGAVFAVACPQPGARQKASSASSEAASERRWQPAERAARHDRHAAGRPPGRLRLSPRDEPEHRRARPPRGQRSTRPTRTGRRRAAASWRSTPGGSRRRAATARRTRCSSTSTRRSRASCRRPATTPWRSSTTRTWRPRSGTRRASPATARPGRSKRLASEMDRTRAITADARRLPRRGRARAPLLPVAALRQPARPLRAAGALRPGLPGRRGGPRAGARAGGRLPRRRPAPVGPRGAQARVVRGAVRRRDRSRRRRGRPGAPGARRRPRSRDRTLVRAELRPRREPGRARLLLRPRREPVRPVDARPAAGRGPWDRGRPALGRYSPRRSTSSRPCSTRSRSRIRPTSRA